MTHTPKSPLHFLSDTKIYEREMLSPHGLNEIRDAMREFARDYLRTFFADNDKEITQNEIETFEAKYYGTL